VNELQLHSRLSALADDLAPGDDPLEMVAGARALHRRRRRARMGVAGAALAVALVAVGVPTAVGSLSAPERGDVAVPSSTAPESTPPSYPIGDESLSQVAEDLRARFTQVGAGPVPDPSADVPCPDAAEQLSTATGMLAVAPAQINAESSVVRGCRWSTEPDGVGPTKDRYDVILVARAETTVDDLLADLDEDAAQPDCDWTRPLDENYFNAVQVCTASDHVVWTLIMVDEDGTGAWHLTTAVGTQMPEAYGLGLSGTSSLWQVVLDLDPDRRAEREVDEELGGLAEALAARTREPLLGAGVELPACSAIERELGTNVAAPLTEEVVDNLADERTCSWTWESDTSTSSATVHFVRDAGRGDLGDVMTDVSAAAAERGHSTSTSTSSAFCISRPAFGDGREGTLEGCRLGDRVQLAFGTPDRAGSGVWILVMNVPVDDDLAAWSRMAMLVELADAAW
jgi:hypothetical protein